jgi:hypothetical protein
MRQQPEFMLQALREYLFPGPLNMELGEKSRPLSKATYIRSASIVSPRR